MSVEDRNCNCITNDCNSNDECNRNFMQTNNFDCPNNTREKMLKEIKSYRFAVIELALYLDTHNDDTKALCLHNKYSKELKDLLDKYQKVYGPLTFEYPCNKWRWIEEPWPWEGGRR